MSVFWNLWIIGLVLANVAFAVWLMYSSSRKVPTPTHPDDVQTTGHVWDGDLAEYNNPLPRWWLYGFYLSVLFSGMYLALYPGLGSYEGTLGWSAQQQYAVQDREAEATLAKTLGQFDGQDLVSLAKNPEAMKIAHNLFAANCAACHGSDAQGAKGFPNLTSPNLTWGHTPEQIQATISNGRMGVMPAWQDALGDQGVKAVANYVLVLSHRPAHDPALVPAGKTTFETICAACHGAAGTGNELLGAPNLTDEFWIYGGNYEALLDTIRHGRNNQMPAHLERLGERRVRLLSAYVLSLNPSRLEATQSTP